MPEAKGRTVWRYPSGGEMRVAQVAPLLVPVPPSSYGGTERVIYDLTEALVA